MRVTEKNLLTLKNHIETSKKVDLVMIIFRNCHSINSKFIFDFQFFDKTVYNVKIITFVI